ncbi:MAG: hypothetical protein PHO02_03965 [Candidatus Nanoarchaeia archaeon]|nr:hypothetical protein [Candidatus Nanoarchaeia archaeon]
MKIKKLVNVLAAVGLAAAAVSLVPHFSRESIEAQVLEVRENEIVTDKGVFENTWSLWEWKISPYEIKQGQKYLLGVYGIEDSWLFSSKKNIMYAELLPQDDF